MLSGPKTQGACRFTTPAKITPIVNILALRRDGYHDVRIALVAVGLYDTIEWHPGAGNLSLAVTGGENVGPPEQNLVLRAARAFAGAAEKALAGQLRLAKRVPAGAGLGGGSANAAGTLWALNHWYGSPLSVARLRELALALGSDVPFFLDPRPSWAEGRGERLTPIAGFPPLELLIVKPPFGIGTAFAYGRCRPRPRAAVPRLESLGAVVAALENDFEPVLFPEFPELERIQQCLRAAGALGALLSGSGSAVFGIFADAAARDRAAEALARAEAAWSLYRCATLTGHDPTPTPLEIRP